MFTDYVLLLFSTTPRRAKGLFNVLRGRRTVSTLFAGLTAGYLDLLDSCHEVPLEDFMAATAALTENGQLTSTAPGCWQLTQAGEHRQAKLRQTLYMPQNFEVFQTTDVRRFRIVSQLALQVVSELVHHDRHYYPVTTDPGIQAQVKQWLRQQSKVELGEQIHAALTAFLTSLADPELPTVFVQGITGYQEPGLTNEQLAAQLGRQPWEASLMHTDVICQWIAWIQRHPRDPFSQLLSVLTQASAISQSAEQTYQAFLKTQQLAAIAQTRHLKMSTVREHLLEVAIWSPDFPFEMVLNHEITQQLATIFAAQPDIVNWSFQEAQAALPTLDFFEFRLFQIMRCQHVRR